MLIRKKLPRPRLRVAVLLGGPSDEREISLKSGAAVCDALQSRGHDCVPFDPAQTNLRDIDWSGYDVAFNSLHGRFGEDGEVQQILEELGVSYTGSGVTASRVAFSKSAAKERFLQSHVPTPSYVLVNEADSVSTLIERASRIGYPLVVKPDSQGSSLGVSLVRRSEHLAAALNRCFSLDAYGLLETAISGSEWTVGFLDDAPLPVIEIRTGRTFFDFQAKYEDNATQYVLDHGQPPSLIRRIERTAFAACRAIGTRGLARVDVMLDEFGEPWVLEVNTVPGMTDHSLVPKAAARLGLSLGDLCEQTIARCLEQSPASTFERRSVA